MLLLSPFYSLGPSCSSPRRRAGCSWTCTGSRRTTRAATRYTSLARVACFQSAHGCSLTLLCHICHSYCVQRMASIVEVDAETVKVEGATGQEVASLSIKAVEAEGQEHQLVCKPAQGQESVWCALMGFIRARHKIQDTMGMVSVLPLVVAASQLDTDNDQRVHSTTSTWRRLPWITRRRSESGRASWSQTTRSLRRRSQRRRLLRKRGSRGGSSSSCRSPRSRRRRLRGCVPVSPFHG